MHKFKFKVQTLRNVELTYPYFHDGGAATLSKAVEVMGRIQFELPPSSDTTPPPQPFGK